MKKVRIVIEKGEESYGAYSPDLAGCVAVGASREEAEEKMYEAIAFELEGLRRDSLPTRKSASAAGHTLFSEGGRNETVATRGRAVGPNHASVGPREDRA